MMVVMSTGPTGLRSSYVAANFPAGVPLSGDLMFSDGDLAHALWVTGRAPADQFSHGASSLWEWVHRVSLVPAYLRATPTGRVVRSNLALDLDRSEKVGLSYALGQAMTGVWCTKVLHVTHLMHVDRYAKSYNVTCVNTKRRADLFGLSGTGWIIAEAKGRSNGIEPSLSAKMRTQKRSISSVSGLPPALTLGCAAAFPPDKGEMVLRLVDPSDDEYESISIVVDLDRFYLAYYRPVLEVLRAGTRVQGPEGYSTVSLTTLGLRVGLLTQIEDRIACLDDSRRGTEGLAAFAQTLLTDVSIPVRGFPDGSIFETDWGEALSNDDYER